MVNQIILVITPVTLLTILNSNVNLHTWSAEFLCYTSIIKYQISNAIDYSQGIFLLNDFYFYILFIHILER